MTQEKNVTTDNKRLLTILEGKPIIRRWKLDMEELNEIKNISNNELDKIVDELDSMGDDDLEYMGDEEIDDDEIENVDADAEDEEIDDEIGNKVKNKDDIDKYI
ncbi:hypothetical protein HN385_07790 [archaeon]|jgi:hypothetical protein|nr:hypothetical protein [archaeon]